MFCPTIHAGTQAALQPIPQATPTRLVPSAQAINEYVILKTITWAATQAEKFGPDKVIVVYLPEEPQETPGVSPSPDKHPLILKLRMLAPETRPSSFPG